MKRAILSALGLLALCSTVLAQEPVVPVGEIAFASDRSGIYQIYQMNADGSNVQVLIENEHPVYTPVWSPDGSKLAHVVDEGAEKLPLFIWDAEQSRVVKIADDVLNLYSLSAWSSDSTHISFANFIGGDSAAGLEFHSASTDGEQNAKIDLNPNDLALIQYMPDQSLLIAQAEGLYSADSAGGSSALMTDYFSYPAALSPTLNRVVGYNFDTATIEIADLNGANPQAVVAAEQQDLLYLLFIGWSPDEQYIWGVGRFANPDTAANATEFRIFVAKSDGSTFHTVNSIDTQLTWSPDSQFIAYTRQDAAGNYQIFTARPDGSDEQQITTEGNNSQPTWRPE